MTPRIWFFEGLDKSGKSTLCRACRFSSGHAMPMYDRGPLSRQLFQEYHKEPVSRLEMWMDLELKLIGAGIYGIVYVKAPIELIRERMAKAGETPQSVEALEEQQEILERLLDCRRRAGLPVLEASTVGLPEAVVRATLGRMGIPFRRFSVGVTA